jgi:hypothetical protein
MTQKTKTYVFIRANGFYPLELENDAAAKANAELNPGTRRVETTDGKTVWTERSAAPSNEKS